MESVDDDELAALLAAPETPVRKTAARKQKGSTRDFDTWFFGLDHTLNSHCDNPNCVDTRGGTTQLTALVKEHNMCRECFLDGWLADEAA